MKLSDSRSLGRWVAQMMVNRQGAGEDGMRKSGSVSWRGGERVTSLDLPFFFFTPCSSTDISLLLEGGEGQLSLSPTSVWVCWGRFLGAGLLEVEEKTEDGSTFWIDASIWTQSVRPEEGRYRALGKSDNGEVERNWRMLS